MASIISAGTTSGTSLNLSADTSGQLELKTGSGPTTAITISSAQLTTIANDATISGLTVGKGGGAVATNTVLGVSAGTSNTTGAYNTFVGGQDAVLGRAAGQLNTTGSINTALGNGSLASNLTGGNNTAVGYRSLGASTASNNTALGAYSLLANTTGDSNVALGRDALTSNTTASQNTAVGYQAFYSNTTGGGVVMGYQAGYSTTTGDLTAFGYRAGYSNTTGNYNVALGPSALYSNTTASNNTAVGYQAGYSITTAANITAVGYQAGYSISTSSTTPESTAIGSQALYTGGGGGDVAVGYRAGYSINTSGGANTAVGNKALESCTTGYYNVAVGISSGQNITTGFNNICIGRNAGIDAVINLTTQSNRAVFGNDGITNAYVKVAWTVTSDARDKTNISDIPHGLAFVQQLQPKQYQFKVSREDDTPHGNKRYGFLAQDILALEGDDPVIIDNEQPDHLKYQGEALVPVLVKAIQELNAKVDAQAAEIAALKGAK